jgi:hypothetical protein
MTFGDPQQQIYSKHQSLNLIQDGRMTAMQRKKIVRVLKTMKILVKIEEVLVMKTLMVTLLSHWRLLHFLMSIGQK